MVLPLRLRHKLGTVPRGPPGSALRRAVRRKRRRRRGVRLASEDRERGRGLRRVPGPRRPDLRELAAVQLGRAGAGPLWHQQVALPQDARRSEGELPPHECPRAAPEVQHAWRGQLRCGAGLQLGRGSPTFALRHQAEHRCQDAVPAPRCDAGFGACVLGGEVPRSARGQARFQAELREPLPHGGRLLHHGQVEDPADADRGHALQASGRRRRLRRRLPPSLPPAAWRVHRAQHHVEGVAGREQPDHEDLHVAGERHSHLRGALYSSEPQLEDDLPGDAAEMRR
mmetsp:Transcript_94345/g.272716  ORF Transcript_94345/g.272716 Transcript_94345/m.272716 type:complete len:284 (+) Transcript_94345:460-1311(+)